MTTPTEVEAKPVPTTDGYRVTVTGLEEGDPALLGFYSVLTLRNGTRRRIAQVVRVVDEDLLRRLRVEVKPGDEIRVSTTVDKAVTDCPTVLRDFCKV
jgi:hypothetical protein